MFLVIFLAAAPLAAQSNESAPAETDEAPTPTAAEWIQQTGIHKIFGYTTLGLAGTTGIMAFVDADIHRPLAYATLGSALTTSVLGAIGYWDYRDIVWPHFLFMGLAETGFALNAFVLEPGSTAHTITGALSYGFLAAGYVAIQLIF